jgi:large subunit ribosomal protein L21
MTTEKKTTKKTTKTAPKKAAKKPVAKKTAKKAPAKKTTAKSAKKSDKLAVIKTGGKQYLVEEGQKIKIEHIKGVEEGKKVTFDEVLLVIDGDKVSVGTPVLKNKVEANVIEVGRSKKVTVVRYKSKSRYHKKKGHRQPFTKVEITKIA